MVLNGTFYNGSFDNAGAVGSMPLPAAYAVEPESADRAVVQLIHCASRYLLYDRLRETGIDPDVAIEGLARGETGELPISVRDIFEAWLQQAAAAIAFATAAVISVVDFEGIVIDGSLPASLVERLTAAVKEALAQINLEGLVRPQIVAGTIGNDARALGGAVYRFTLNLRRIGLYC